MPDSRNPRPAWACVLFLMAPSGAQAGWPPWTPRGDANRDDIPAEYRWDLSHLYANAQEWERHFTKVETRLPDLRPCAGTLAQGPARLRECLDLAFDLTYQVQLLATWAEADFTTRRTDPAAKARSDRIQALHTRLAQATAWIEPEMLEMDPATLRKFVATEPGLAQYDHYIDDLIRRRPHVLTKDQERLLALSGDLLAAPESIHGALEEDIPFPRIRDEQGQEQALTFATFPKFRASPDREVRRNAVDAFLKTLKAWGQSFAASLDAAVKAHVFVARARGYESALVASLHQNAVPVQVYESLLEVVHRNLPTTLHRYVDLRKRLLGIDQVHYYDLYVPMFPKARREVPYGEAVEMVRQALRPLGPEYHRVLSEGLAPENGWVDVFPAKGKRPGAYCNAAWRKRPIVFLNHMNELEDAFTLAHEFGHALHFHLAGQAQPFPKADAPIFLAEIASTFNEELLLDHLLKQARSTDERLALLNKRLENLRTTIFRQTLFAEFEKAIHEEVERGGALTAERMAEIYEGLVRTYYGPDFAIGPEDGYEWAYIPHFYYNFYVYQYATGLISAIALSQKVLKGEKGAVTRYLDFLEAGGSDYPVEILRRAGVDLTRPESMQAAFDLFARTLDEIETLLRKKK